MKLLFIHKWFFEWNKMSYVAHKGKDTQWTEKKSWEIKTLRWQINRLSLSKIQGRYGDIYLTFLVQTMKIFYQTNIGVQFVSNCVILDQRYHRANPSCSTLFSRKMKKIVCLGANNVWVSSTIQSVKRLNISEQHIKSSLFTYRIATRYDIV